jgi:hypothetical protein
MRPPPEDALRERVIFLRVNRSGDGEDDLTVIEPLPPA